MGVFFVIQFPFNFLQVYSRILYKNSATVVFVIQFPFNLIQVYSTILYKMLSWSCFCHSVPVQLASSILHFFLFRNRIIGRNMSKVRRGIEKGGTVSFILTDQRIRINLSLTIFILLVLVPANNTLTTP
jgi:hypothetical protein